jgi:hypothetical protein
MARIPILNDPGQLNTGNQTIRTPDLPAVTNASIGKALDDVGSVAFDISEKAKRANDVTKLTEASLAMNKAQADFATWQQSPEGQDEKNWLPKWQSLQNDIKSTFDKEALTPDARLQLTDRFSNWATRGTIQVQASAIKQTGQRMEQSIDNAVKSKDFNAARQGVNDAVSAGLILPEQAQAKKLSIDADEKDSKWNSYVLQRERLADPTSRTQESIFQLEQMLDASRDSMEPERYQLEVDNLNDMKDETFVYQEIQKNPERVVEMMNNPDFAPSLSAPQQREKIKNQALARIEEMQMEEQRAVMNGILTGNIQNMKQAETLMPRSDAIVKAKIQSVFDKKPPTQYEASILKRALEKAVEEYDPTNDPEDAKTFQIVDTINRLNLYDEKLTSSLRERFYKKQQQRTPPSPIESEIANHKKFLDYVYEPKLKALMDSKTGEVPVDKQEEFRSLLSIRDQLATDFERMVEAGEIKTREQARNASVRMLAEPYANQVIDYYRYAPSSNGQSGQLQLTPEEIQMIEKQRLQK